MGLGLLLGAISMAIATAVHWRVYKKYYYLCHACGEKFRPASFAESMFALNMGQERRVRCTHCGKIGLNLACPGKI